MILSSICVLCASRIRANDRPSLSSEPGCPILDVALQPLGCGDDMAWLGDPNSPSIPEHRHLLTLSVVLHQPLSYGKVEYFFSEMYALYIELG